MLAPPAIFGTVVGVNGNTITVSGKITVSSGYPNGSATTSIFTVNAANAQIQQNTAASTIASIAVGDTVLVQGILNGTTMAATFIRDTTNTAQSTNLSSCLPSGVTLDTVVSIDDGGANKITVGQTLNSLGASCNSGQLVDSNNKVIKFYNLVGCWGNPPYNYQQILSQQNQDIQNLKAQYTVITLTCNPSGLHNIS